MIDDDADTKGAVLRWITFKLGSETYAIEVKRVREILRIDNIFPVPGSPDCVVGITNIRGNVVTVIDGRTRLNLPSAALTDAARMIVLENDNDVAAVIVDKVTDVVDLPVSAIENNPKMNVQDDSRYISGVISHEGGLIIIVNVDWFITDEQHGIAAGF